MTKLPTIDLCPVVAMGTEFAAARLRVACDRADMRAAWAAATELSWWLRSWVEALRVRPAISLTPEQQALKDKLEAEIQEWAEKNIVGHVNTRSVRADTEFLARRLFAEGMGLPLERVALVNPRWTETEFEADGFEILPEATADA